MEKTKENNQDTLTLNEELNVRSANAIKLAIDCKALFELYAYRIVDHDTFVESTQSNVKRYIDEEIQTDKKFN